LEPILIKLITQLIFDLNLENKTFIRLFSLLDSGSFTFQEKLIGEHHEYPERMNLRNLGQTSFNGLCEVGEGRLTNHAITK